MIFKFLSWISHPNQWRIQRFDPYGESLVEGGPLAIFPLAKTQKNVKKDSESMDVVDVCTR